MENRFWVVFAYLTSLCSVVFISWFMVEIIMAFIRFPIAKALQRIGPLEYAVVFLLASFIPIIVLKIYWDYRIILKSFKISLFVMPLALAIALMWSSQLYFFIGVFIISCFAVWIAISVYPYVSKSNVLKWVYIFLMVIGMIALIYALYGRLFLAFGPNAM